MPLLILAKTADVCLAMKCALLYCHVVGYGMPMSMCVVAVKCIWCRLCCWVAIWLVFDPMSLSFEFQQGVWSIL